MVRKNIRSRRNLFVVLFTAGTFLVALIWNVFLITPVYEGSAILCIPSVPSDVSKNFNYSVGNLCNVNDIVGILQSNEFLDKIGKRMGINVETLKKETKIYILGSEYLPVNPSIANKQNLIQVKFSSYNRSAVKTFFDLFLENSETLKCEQLALEKQKLLKSEIESIQIQLNEISSNLERIKTEINTTSGNIYLNALNTYSNLSMLNNYLHDKKSKLEQDFQLIYGFEYVEGPIISTKPYPSFKGKLLNVIYVTLTVFVVLIVCVLLIDLMREI